MHKAIIRLFTLAFLLITALPSVLGQEYSFQKMGVEDGLSQSVATTMVQDANGSLWIGTMSGLTNYNGHELTVFGEKDGLAEDWVTASFKDNNGNTWFGHWGGGVSVKSKNDAVFSNLNFEKYSNFKTITAILEDNDSNIWFATDGAGIFVYEIKSQTIVTLSEKDGFIDNHVNVLSTDAKGNIWIGTQKGIAIYNVRKEIGSKGAFSMLTSNDGLSSEVINDLILLNDGSMLASTPEGGLCKISNTNNQFEIEFLHEKIELPSFQINCILQDQAGNIWIGTNDKGVVKYHPKTGNSKVFSTRQGLNYFNIRSLFEDREKNIWIGTDLGINLFKGEQFMIYNERDGIINNIVWAVSGDTENNIWLGTNKGLSKLSFSGKKGELKKAVTKNYSIKEGLSHEIVLSVYPDDEGRVWCGTGFGGVCVLENGKFSIINSDMGLASNTVFSISKDEDGDMWFGTSEGVSKYNVSTKNITNFTEVDGLGGKHTYKIFKDSKNRMWFSVLGGYLSVYENNSFTHFDSTSGLNEKFITCINEDQQGNIWLGAYGSGIYKYDGQNFTNYSADNGLSSNVPYSITSDNENHLWVGTSRGIDQFDQTEQLFKNYRKKEGFMGVEPNPNAIYRDNDGNIWVGTIMGVVKFDLQKKRINAEEPYVLFGDLKINHQTSSIPDDQELSYKQNSLTFNYLGISLTNPPHIKYQYLLEGLDNEWSPVVKSPFATYSNLPPGSYSFKVKASNGDGVWNDQPASIDFIITPPFWKTWWFYVLCFVALIAGLYYGDKLRVHKLKEANNKLEIKVTERTKEIAEKNIELGRKNRDILDSIRYAERIQKAILPTENEIKEHLPHSFVFYQPKDIVSGDFYWMQVKDNKILFAAADCTGHGVPGAFMSIIGYNGLNKAVKEEGITKPSEVLNRLSEIVEGTLQYSDNMEVNDGLDIAICALDMNDMKLEYAGAFNPLYLVRNGELLETKGDRSTVGGSIIIRQKANKFSNHTIDIQKNDAFYLFSDGIADQFGGPKGRKFRYSQVKELFLASSEQPMSKQKELIDEAMKKWKGEIDQIDDMVVMGVKVI